MRHIFGRRIRVLCVLSLIYILWSDRAGGGEVVWANVWKTQGGAVPSITDTVYILWLVLWLPL